MDRFGQSRRRLRVCAVFESIKISKDRVGLTARYEIGGAGLAERGDRLMPEPEHRLAGAAARLGRARARIVVITPNFLWISGDEGLRLSELRWTPARSASSLTVAWRVVARRCGSISAAPEAAIWKRMGSSSAATVASI